MSGNVLHKTARYQLRGRGRGRGSSAIENFRLAHSQYPENRGSRPGPVGKQSRSSRCQISMSVLFYGLGKRAPLLRNSSPEPSLPCRRRRGNDGTRCTETPFRSGDTLIYTIEAQKAYKRRRASLNNSRTESSLPSSRRERARSRARRKITLCRGNFFDISRYFLNYFRGIF